MDLSWPRVAGSAPWVIAARRLTLCAQAPVPRSCARER